MSLRFKIVLSILVILFRKVFPLAKKKKENTGQSINDTHQSVSNSAIFSEKRKRFPTSVHILVQTCEIYTKKLRFSTKDDWFMLFENIYLDNISVSSALNNLFGLFLRMYLSKRSNLNKYWKYKSDVKISHLSA